MQTRPTLSPHSLTHAPTRPTVPVSLRRSDPPSVPSLSCCETLYHGTFSLSNTPVSPHTLPIYSYPPTHFFFVAVIVGTLLINALVLAVFQITFTEVSEGARECVGDWYLLLRVQIVVVWCIFFLLLSISNR